MNATMNHCDFGPIWLISIQCALILHFQYDIFVFFLFISLHLYFSVSSPLFLFLNSSVHDIISVCKTQCNIVYVMRLCVIARLHTFFIHMAKYIERQNLNKTNKLSLNFNIATPSTHIMLQTVITTRYVGKGKI